MYLPFPERFPLILVVLFATILSCIQQLQGTSLSFTLCSFLFIVISAMAFNVVGGFTRPSGGYIFFYAFGVVAGITGKAVLGEAADTNLLSPDLTIRVFLGGAVSLLVAAVLSRKLRRERPILQEIIKPQDMRNAVTGCIATGLALRVLLYKPPENGSILSALSQLNEFLTLAIILGVIYQIRKTGGTSALSIPIILSMLLSFIDGGLLHYSKQGMFTPIVCWLIVVAAMRYRMPLIQVGLTVFVAFILVYYFVPYSQVGRNLEGRDTVDANIGVAMHMLETLPEIRKDYIASDTEDLDSGRSYYSHESGFLSRLQILRPDDDLIHVTEERGAFGLSPLPLYVINLIPRALYPNKPDVTFGNVYAREAGSIIDSEDTTTHISFSPTGEAYHLAKWFGVLVITPILWTILFAHFDSLCGDTRRSPWGLLVVVVFSHSAPEGMLGAPIAMMGMLTIQVVFVAVMSAYLMPVLGALIGGADRRTIPQVD